MSLNVNGRAYDWGDVDINLPGLAMQAQGIDYDDELEKEAVYGAGHKPRGYGRGNYKATAKLTVLRDDFDLLLDYCKAKKKALYGLEIPKIIVSYANDGERTRSDVINKVTITKSTHKAAQADKSLTIDIDLLVYGTIVRDKVEAV